MTLPSSGPLTLANIQTEFGGTNPIGMNEYYAGGGLVPAGTSGTYGAVPSSGALSVQNFYGTSNFVPVYIENVFSTYLYTGNGTTQTISNGIDLATKGGMVWTKSRTNTYWHEQTDTVRGASKYISSNSTFAQNNSQPNHVTAFNSNGFSVGNETDVNANNIPFGSWTFAKQAKFFEIVTWTGNNANPRTITHNLGSTPGFILIKNLTTSEDWVAWHKDAPNGWTAALNTTDGFTRSDNNCNGVTSTTFNTNKNSGSDQYVAYLFAHNAGGFGLNGTDNVISCGIAYSNTSVNLGFEPQWIMDKDISAGFNWNFIDSMRGMTITGEQYLQANTSGAESNSGSTYFLKPTATGFNVPANYATSSGFIYIAIRRGPMKVPTAGPNVFTSRSFSDYSANVDMGFVTDFAINKVTYYNPDQGTYTSGTNFIASRLTGTNPLRTNSTAAQGGGQYPTGWDVQNGYKWSNGSGYDIFGWAFARAPSFADVVCYTGNGSTQNINHNLSAVPELMWVKRIDLDSYWPVYVAPLGNSAILQLQASTGVENNAPQWNNTTPTSTVFSLGSTSGANASGGSYIAYLFATCAGVSKVGSYTGTGTTTTIDCGFTSGARYVLIKRTNTSGNWTVYDASRGIQSGNDPYLTYNTTDAAITNTNYVDSTSTGFQLIGSGLNVSGSTYIFLAIA